MPFQYFYSPNAVSLSLIKPILCLIKGQAPRYISKGDAYRPKSKTIIRTFDDLDLGDSMRKEKKLSVGRAAANLVLSEFGAANVGRNSRVESIRGKTPALLNLMLYGGLPGRPELKISYDFLVTKLQEACGCPKKEVTDWLTKKGVYKPQS